MNDDFNNIRIWIYIYEYENAPCVGVLGCPNSKQTEYKVLLKAYIHIVLVYTMGRSMGCSLIGFGS